MKTRRIVIVLFVFGAFLIGSFGFVPQATAQAPATSVYPQQEGYVDANGVMIYYKTLGKGEPLVIMHGGPGASHDPALIVPANNDLFSSGTLGRYSRALNSVMENLHKEPAEVAGD